MRGQKPVRMYTLSTCSHCGATKKFMKDHGINCDITDVDLLTGPEQMAVIQEVKKLNPRLSFPTIVIGDDVIIGFQEDRIREALGI